MVARNEIFLSVVCWGCSSIVDLRALPDSPHRRLDLQGLEKEFADLGRRLEQTMGMVVEQHKQQRLSQITDRQECFLDVLLSLEGESKLSDKSIMAVNWVSVTAERMDLLHMLRYKFTGVF